MALRDCRHWRDWRAIAWGAALIAALASSGDRSAACGVAETIILVNIVRPGDPAAFDRGVLGVVHPTYERRYLIRAYRRLQGLDTAFVSQAPGRDVEQPRGWLEAREGVLKTGQPVRSYLFNRDWPVIDFQTFQNCGDDAFESATRTLAAGSGSLAKPRRS